MPIKKSAIKRAKQNISRRDRNRVLKKNFRNAIKDVVRALEAKKPEEVAKKASKAYATIDKAAKKKAIHKNAATRRKSRLVKKINKALGKPAKLTKSKKVQKQKKASPKK